MMLSLVAVVSLIGLSGDDQKAVKLAPLDAFRKNLASVKVAMDFEYGGVKFDGAADRVWAEKKPASVKTPFFPLVGHWVRDGTVELYRFSSPDQVIERAQREKPQIGANKAFFPFHFVPKTEALWDGHTLAWHNIDRLNLTRPGSSWKVIQILPITQEPGPLTEGRGPFYWGFSYTFPEIIDARFPEVIPTRWTSVRGGHPVEVEVYRQNLPDGSWHQFEVSYDPAIGHLPRFARFISGHQGGAAIAKEMYLTEARRCASGGFVPTEWYDRTVVVHEFDTLYPHYTDDTALEPAASTTCCRFRALSFDDRGDEIAALTDLQGVHGLSTPGGVVDLPNDLPFLTLPKLKALAGLDSKIREK